MKVTIKGFVYEREYTVYEDGSWRTTKAYNFWSTDDMGKHIPELTLVGPAEFEYEIPEGWNPIPAKLAALEQQKEAARKKFVDELRRIEEQISKLMAIEYKG